MAVVSAALVVPPPAPDAPGAVEITTLDVPTVRAAATGGELAPGPFRMLALSAIGSGLEAEHAVEVRVREAGGAWSAWTHVPFVGDEGPDGGDGDDWEWSTPVWTGDAERAQVRLAAGVAAARVRLHALDIPTGGPEDAPRAAAALTTQPAIVSRAQWGADERLRSGQPSVARSGLRMAFVHHTAGTNSYSADQSDDLVRGIYAFHTQSRGWGDIGYNFLVDRYGRVFEGRAGGIERAVVGAHTQGFNTGSTGVAVMGTFDGVEPTAAAGEALRRLLAWKLDVHHVDPAGTVTVVSGGSPKYPEGTSVTLPTISGHRDTGSTSCPGDRLYAQLPAIRAAVAEIGLPKIFDPRPTYQTAPPGSAGTVTARLSAPASWAFSLRNSQGIAVYATAGTGEAVRASWPATATGVPGVYRWTLDASAAGATARPAAGIFNVVAPMSTSRAAGVDRYATAVAVSRRTHQAGADVVYLATGESFADALAAGPAAAVEGAPILLTARDALPASTRDELVRLEAGTVKVLGGPLAVSDAVAEELRSLGLTVQRVAGSDRFATAAAVSAPFGARAKTAYVVTGTNFPDALAAGAAAGSVGAPILLVTRDTLPAATAKALERLTPAAIVVVGGPGVISPAVEAALDAHTSGPVRRVAGADRYGTAVAVSSDTFATAARVHFATGLGFADALPGGPAAAAVDGPLLLVSRTCVPDVVRDELTRLRTGAVTLLGGTSTLSEGVERFDACE